MLQINPIKNRMLFLSPVVQAGWEREATIDDFEKTGDLGSGAFGTVGRYKHKKSGVVYALKQMTKSKLKASGMIDQIKTEIKIMYSLQHEHIIKLFNHFEDDEHIYLIIEYASGGQLWQKLHTMEGKRFPEKMVAQYIKDLASVLEFLHGKGIIHRDIKPENILLDKTGRIKLADFGWSNFLKPNVPRTTFCGTLDYLPPEMLTSTHSHDHMVDIWSIGILTYELLTGRAPFMPLDTKNLKDIERQTQENIANVKYEFPKDFPSLAKDLVSKILKKNPKTRIGLSEIKSHPWVKLNAQTSKLAKETAAEKMIENINFGKNMAEKKNIVKIVKKDGELDPAFTEDEIIEIARPDSLLEKDNLPEFTNPFSKLDSKIQNFKSKQIGLKSGEDYVDSPFNTDKTHKFDAELKRKDDEIRALKEEIEHLKAQSKFGGDELRVKQLQNENKSLKKEIDEVYRLLGEKDLLLHECKTKLHDLEDRFKKQTEKNKNDKTLSKDDSQKLKETNFLLENKLIDLIQAHKEEKNYYEKKIRTLEAGLAGSKIAFNPDADLVEQNRKLNEQVSQLENIIKSKYGDPSPIKGKIFS